MGNIVGETKQEKLKGCHAINGGLVLKVEVCSSTRCDGEQEWLRVTCAAVTR